MQVVTLVTLATLPRARVLAGSLERHQPDWNLDVLLLGREELVAAAVDAERSLRLRSASQELELDTERLIARHDEHELSVLLAPSLLRTYAQRTSAAVLHLPSSAWVNGALEPVADALAGRNVLLVPRLRRELPADGLEPSPKQLERAGRMADATLAVEATPVALGFLRWWEARAQQWLGSLDGRTTGARPEDRPWLSRYLELAPARFASGVLDDPGCNLSLWNLHEHTLEQRGQAIVVDGHWPLRYLDLQGFDPEHPHRLSRVATRARVSRSPVLRELTTAYAAELLAAGWQDVDRRRDIGRSMHDGFVYDEAMRALYARALALGEDFGDVFSEEGSRAFTAWLEGPAPEGARQGITRYVFYRVARERPDVMRAYPDLDGEDGPGYHAWCWAFGREELTIPDRFMPRETLGRATLPHSRITMVTQTSGSTPHNSRVTAPTQTADAPTQTAGPPSVPLVNGAPSNDASANGASVAVRVTGYLGNTLGLGAAARGYVQALRAVAVPVSTVTVPLHHLAVPVAMEAHYGRHGFEDLVHEGRHGFEIVAVNADELPDFVERLGDGYFEGPRIGIWGWETNTIPPRWQKAFALIDEIWVYSRFMAQNIGAAASLPVLALPPPVAPREACGPPLRLGVPDGFLFLFVFDYLSTIQRKNPVGLIEAFKRAFAPNEGPRLLIKTINAPLRPLADEEVLWSANAREDVHVIDRSLSGEELERLMAACDCYVSLHRSEGFGLTMAEAMAIGKPVIGTGYSGNVDFMTPENSYLVDYKLSRVGPECEIYPPDGEWAEPSVAHAAQLMRHVYEHREEAAQVAQRGREDVARLLAPEATGAAMRARLEELAR